MVPDENVTRAVLSVAQGLMLYHRYEARGMEHVPPASKVIVAVSHSLATYDGFLLAAAIYLETGRYGVGLGDRRLFQTPGLGTLCSKLGIVEGKPSTAERLLREGNLLYLAPGGMRESLRPSTQKYRISWEGRLGFARLAIRTQTPVILAACPAADDLYTVYDNPLTAAVYRHFKWPLPLARGLGPTVIPRPVKLVHRIAPPVAPPPFEGEGDPDEAVVKRFHGRLVKKMSALLRS